MCGQRKESGMTTMVARAVEQRMVVAWDGATAWYNAFIASAQDEERGVLYRTLSVEFFKGGVQFIGCDGHMFFRTWAPYSDAGDLPIQPPEWGDQPLDAVVVMDRDKFALGFMRTLLSALRGTEIPADMTLTIEEADEEDEPALGEELTPYVLTFEALGQRLSCPLYEDRYPDWRKLDLGIEDAERIDKLIVGTKLFKAVGKLREVSGVDLSFQGEDRAVHFKGTSPNAPVSGLLMPMRRMEEPKPEADADQLDHGDGGT